MRRCSKRHPERAQRVEASAPAVIPSERSESAVIPSERSESRDLHPELERALLERRTARKNVVV
jgi:hypothetical protein